MYISIILQVHVSDGSFDDRRSQCRLIVLPQSVPGVGLEPAPCQVEVQCATEYAFELYDISIIGL